MLVPVLDYSYVLLRRIVNNRCIGQKTPGDKVCVVESLACPSVNYSCCGISLTIIYVQRSRRRTRIPRIRAYTTDHNRHYLYNQNKSTAQEPPSPQSGAAAEAARRMDAQQKQEQHISHFNLKNMISQ